MANVPQLTILPEDPTSDTDSAIGSDTSSLTDSLRSSLLQGVNENGRSYHRYSGQSGSQYYLPEDDLEQDRSDLQHQMFLYTFGALHNSPLDKENIRNVLDLGTGTGIWAMDFADEYVNANVIGTDLSPIQPDMVPPNCKFEIDDFNADWTFGQEKFDFIHARALVGSSRDFPALIRQAYDALVPGGWLEMNDVLMPFASEDGTMDNTKLQTWCERQVESCAKAGVDTTSATHYKKWMIEQGFEGVTELQFKWPVGTWPKDKRFKFLGSMTKANFLTGLEGFTLRLWTGVLGMSAEEVLVFLAFVRKDIENPRIHSYWPVYSVYGRKPLVESPQKS